MSGLRSPSYYWFLLNIFFFLLGLVCHLQITFYRNWFAIPEVRNIFSFWRLNVMQKTRMMAQNSWFFENLNIMCFDTKKKKKAFDMFMIIRNGLNSRKNRKITLYSRRKRKIKSININDHKIIPWLLLRIPINEIRGNFDVMNKIIVKNWWFFTLLRVRFQHCYTFLCDRFIGLYSQSFSQTPFRSSTSISRNM